MRDLLTVCIYLISLDRGWSFLFGLWIGTWSFYPNVNLTDTVRHIAIRLNFCLYHPTAGVARGAVMQIVVFEGCVAERVFSDAFIGVFVLYMRTSIVEEDLLDAFSSRVFLRLVQGCSGMSSIDVFLKLL